METNLTRRQAQVLDLIERGTVPPTLREIGEIMGIRSTNGVNDHLRALERKGHIRRSDMKSRHLTVTTPLTVEERIYFDLPVVHRCQSCGQALSTMSAASSEVGALSSGEPKLTGRCA